MIQLRNRDQIIENSGKQVLATLVASFLEKQERIIRENRFHRNKSYTNLIPASRNGVGIKSIQPVFNLALDEAILEASSINVDQGDNKLKEESMKQQLKRTTQRCQPDV